MPSKSPLVPLSNIKHNILLAQQFMSGLSSEAFRADRRTVYAVTRCLEIISEASRKLPLELKQRHPNIPWRDIARLPRSSQNLEGLGAYGAPSPRLT